MGFLIQMKENIAEQIEKRGRYRFWDKERERSNHAMQFHDKEFNPNLRSCRHNRIAWSGPPHDIVQCITCLDCNSWVTEPEMRDLGFDFNDCPDWEYEKVMNARLANMQRGNSKQFFLSHK